MRLCLFDLARVTGGILHLASMPPRDGELAAINTIVLSPHEAGENDVLWCLDPQPFAPELALLRGALAVVMSAPAIEPWPGRACLQVANPRKALADFMASAAGRGGQFLSAASELKDLQLWSAACFCISPPARQKCRMTKVKCRMNRE